MGKRRALALLAVLCTAVTLAVSVLAWHGGPVNYRQSDATWHVLLTMRAYDETPASVHHFLPLVTLGAPDDKGLSWGATVADTDGNYYYTSFSAAGFVAPWAFCKLLHLPQTEGSLYLFNRFVLWLSLLALAALLYGTFAAGGHGVLLAALGVLAYATAPEVLHGTGLVYWPQSLFQLVFLLQLLTFRHAGTSRRARIAFWLLCVLGPYLEWTGYVANAAFALAPWVGRPHAARANLKTSAAIAAATGAAGGLYLWHYASVIDLGQLIGNTGSRFFARDISSLEALYHLLAGYKNSFWLLWAVLAGLLLAVLLTGGGGELVRQIRRKCWLYLVLCLPLLENVLLVEHAITYSYDRMKLGFVLVLLLCDACGVLLARRRRLAGAAAVATALLCAVNVYAYRSDATRVWAADFRTTNIELAQKLAAYRADSVLGTPVEVRGYTNLLFDRGVYEYCFTPQPLIEAAQENGKRYAIYIEPVEDAAMGWSMYAYRTAQIYDTYTGRWQELR